MRIPILDKEVPDKQVYFAVGGAALGYFLGPRFVPIGQPAWIHAALGGTVGYLVQPSVSP